MSEKKYKISIMGDSISTYLTDTERANPIGYKVYYRGQKLEDSGLTSMSDTWWMQVINGLGGEVCVNNSYSGSLVSEFGFPAGDSPERCGGLHTCDNRPDIILIYMGVNDQGFGKSIGMQEPYSTRKFYGAYRLMLRQIKANYPEAKVICGTLAYAFMKGLEEKPPIPEIYRERMAFNEAIRTAAKEEGCLVADIAAAEKRFESIDFGHPTKQGHATLAALWLDSLRDLGI